jgi:hypothetical protein
MRPRQAGRETAKAGRHDSSAPSGSPRGVAEGPAPRNAPRRASYRRFVSRKTRIASATC